MFRSRDDVLRSLASGGGTSAVVRSAEAPLERIKILLQNQNMAPAEHRRYSGALDVAVRVFREQGILAFWRGNLTNCARIVPSSAIRFTLMDQFQALAAYGLPDKTTKSLPLHRQMLAGALSGACTAVVVYPLDLTRTKLSADVGVQRRYAGIVDCIRQTKQTHGWRGNYRGLLVSVLEISPYTALSMGGYEYFKHMLPTQEPGSSAAWFALQKVAVGWTSGLAGSLICYPLDTVKRQLMLDGSAGFQSKYEGAITTCIRVMYQEGGVQSFYRGCLFNALKSAPCAGLALVINDALRSLLGFQTR